ncbi:MAG: hypothetical protein JWM68_369 [Verrucomicrobiales bacterium]|nr:hypothetical protein [Verrucomicrobiales bacterium]
MLGFLSRYAKIIVAIFALTMFGFTQTERFQSADSVQKFEGLLIDQRFQYRGILPADPNIELIGIQTSSLSLDTLFPEEIEASEALRLMKRPWPWNRKIYSMLLEKLMDSGAKVVAFDFFFKGEMEGDEEFARTLHKYKDRAMIGSLFDDLSEAGGGGRQFLFPTSSLILDTNDPISGYVNASLDVDRVYRRNGCTENDVIAFAGMAARKFGGNIAFPPPDHSNLINYLGPSGTFTSLPIENIFVDKLWQAPPFSGGKIFQNKIVIVGPMASIFHDEHQTPFGQMPGPELHAHRIASLIQGSTIQESSGRFDFLVSLGMVLVALGVCIAIRNVFLKGIFLAVIGAGFLFMCQSVFTYQNLSVAMVAPLFGLVTTGTFGLFFQYVLEWIEKHRINNVLEKYVSKNVAKTILKNPKSFVEAFTGKKQKVAILFCDIRGFTTLTESVDATELVAQLNEYFAQMVHIIEEEKGGTLQKFIGDAIMAGWGDFIIRGGETDARLAIETALEMRSALVALNAKWKGKPNRTELAIGIGINYGEVVLGNIGSTNRMELTVLGDGINLAARFESSTKQFHTDLLVGEGAQALTRDHFVFRTVGLITFKGKTKPVEVFSVLSDKTVPTPVWLATYHEGIMLFRQREFVAATERFKCAEQVIGSEDFLCQMYLKASAQFVQEPPPAEWDGVFILKEK